MHAWLDDVFRDAAVPGKTAHAIRLCLEEAVMNVVMHGYGPGQPGVIAVALWPCGAGLCAQVSDSAAPFDPTAPRAVRTASVGGRGLQLIRRFATESRYRRQDGRNHLTLSFAPGASPAVGPRG